MLTEARSRSFVPSRGCNPSGYFLQRASDGNHKYYWRLATMLPAYAHVGRVWARFAVHAASNCLLIWILQPDTSFHRFSWALCAFCAALYASRGVSLAVLIQEAEKRDDSHKQEGPFAACRNVVIYPNIRESPELERAFCS